MSNEVVQLPARPGAAHSLAEIEKLAEAIAESGMFGIKTKAQAMVLMAISQAEGRHPALAARDYHIIQGQPAKTAVAMQRDFLEAGGKIKWIEVSDTTAEAEFTHPKGGTATIRWDLAQAERAGLRGRDMWKRYPRHMLRSRVVAEGVRTVFPAATSGMNVPEEVREFASVTATNEPAATNEMLDQFAAGGDTEPPPQYDLRAETRSASLRGTARFRQHFDTLSAVEKSTFSKEEMEAFWQAAKAADDETAENDPFGLPPPQGEMLQPSQKGPTR